MRYAKVKQRVNVSAGARYKIFELTLELELEHELFLVL